MVFIVESYRRMLTIHSLKGCDRRNTRIFSFRSLLCASHAVIRWEVTMQARRNTKTHDLCTQITGKSSATEARVIMIDDNRFSSVSRNHVQELCCGINLAKAV